MKKLISIILTLILIFSFGTFATAENNSGHLSFKENGTFTILHITDTQDDHYPSPEMLNLIRRSIEESKPDLIVFTGDIVEDKRVGDFFVDKEPGREGVCVYDKNGDIDFDKTLVNIEKAVDAVFSVLEESGVPYVIAQGNNDHKCGITNSDWLEIYSRYPHNLTSDMSDDAEGRIDYYTMIYGSDGSPEFNIWLMDTGRGGINNDQVDWYRNTSNALKAENNGNVIPAFTFQHIPVIDVGNLFVECKAWDYGATYNNGRFYRLNPKTAAGRNFYAYIPCEPSYQFAAWKECGDVIGAYFGHQHVEGFTGTYDGIELGLTYGMEFAKTGPYGYRVITLHEDNISEFANDLYTYSGSFRLKTDTVKKQTDFTPESNQFTKLLFYAFNIFKSVLTMIFYIFE